jgi:hypothetical protein
MCTLTETTCFDGSSFMPYEYSTVKGGVCLVPGDLIDSYQIATNWSTLYAGGYCLFWALEDYTVDGTTTGEINWSKFNTDREEAFPTT